MPRIEEHRFIGRPGQVAPDLFRREAQDGRQPSHHRLRQVIQSGLRRAPRSAVRPGGVEPIFDDIEIETAEFDHAEVMNLLIDLVKLVIAIGRHDVVLQAKGLGDHPLIDGHQVIERYCMPLRIEAVQVAQEKAQRVAHAPIGIADPLEDLLRDAHLVGVVGRRDPQPNYVRAQCAGQLLRRENIAERLGHLAAVFIHGETMREHAAIRCAAVHGDRGQQRAVEPPAVLVRALEIQIARRGDFRANHAETVMHDAGIEPHVHDVGGLVVLIQVDAQLGGRVQVEPRVDAVAFHQLGDFRDQLMGARMQLPGHSCRRTMESEPPRSVCRDTHQSGRAAIMLVMRCSPQAGIQSTCEIASSAALRSPACSMLMNHCGVARKITGVL